MKLELTQNQIEEKAKEIKREYNRTKSAKYQRKYRAKHRKQLNEYHRQYMKNHPGKAKEYQDRYWNKKALEVLNRENSNRITTE